MSNEQEDPVCKMKVATETSLYHLTHQNQEYFFCSSHCLKKFERDPNKYLSIQESISAEEYTCPMHPQIVQDHPGNCPICGMSLEPVIAKLGFKEDTEYKNMLFRFWVGAAFSILLVLTMSEGIFQFILSTPVVIWAGQPFFQRGWQSIVNRSLNMFSLISLGVGVAYFYSLIALFFPHIFPSSFHHQGGVPLYFETAAMITVLALMGQVLELKARSQTSQAIQALLERAAKTAKVVEHGQEREIPIEQVKIGAILRVRPGDKIPIDGIITEGKSAVDESMVTGESIPNEKDVNSVVIGGTINQQGSFLMRAEKIGSETLLSRIIQMVATAQRSRAPIQSLADKISSYFVPSVVFIALLTFLIWFLVGPEPSFVYGLVNAVAVLIIACPCALGLATPLSIMVGMGKGAENGVLIKNAESLEKLEKIKTLIVDKTGTLTEGKPTVSKIIAVEEGKENEVIKFAAAVEKNSEHPLAYSILQEAKNRSLSIPKVENFHAYAGGGVSGLVENHEVLVGKLSFLEERHINGSQFKEEVEGTALYVAIDGQAAGLIIVCDLIKPSSFEAVRELHQLGIQVIMLSGDNQHTADFVAKKLKIDEVHANVTPDNKLDFVKNRKGEFVAMAGDGINDAPALASADIGIAMGTGTDVAMESADLTLVKGDLMGIVRGIHLSHAVMKNIRQNLFFAFFYNALGIPIAAGLLYPFTGLLLNPMIAALAMSLSSVSVIMNSLRLKHLKL